jgi:hypothetical protein
MYSLTPPRHPPPFLAGEARGEGEARGDGEARHDPKKKEIFKGRGKCNENIYFRPSQHIKKRITIIYNNSMVNMIWLVGGPQIACADFNSGTHLYTLDQTKSRREQMHLLKKDDMSTNYFMTAFIQNAANLTSRFNFSSPIPFDRRICFEIIVVKDAQTNSTQVAIEKF